MPCRYSSLAGNSPLISHAFGGQGSIYKSFQNSKLTLEEYKNKTVKNLPHGISDSHREPAISDAASQVFHKNLMKAGEAKEESHDKTKKIRTDFISCQRLRGIETKLRQMGIKKRQRGREKERETRGDGLYLSINSV